MRRFLLLPTCLKTSKHLQRLAGFVRRRVCLWKGGSHRLGPQSWTADWYASLGSSGQCGTAHSGIPRACRCKWLERESPYCSVGPSYATWAGNHFTRGVSCKFRAGRRYCGPGHMARHLWRAEPGFPCERSPGQGLAKWILDGELLTAADVVTEVGSSLPGIVHKGRVRSTYNMGELKGDLLPSWP